MRKQALVLLCILSVDQVYSVIASEFCTLVMAHYDIFRHNLAIKYPAYGHALWEPSTGGRYPAVSVGDVGFIREGQFHRLFNALLSPADPSHRFGVPEENEQLRPHVDDHIIIGTLTPHNFCSTGVTLESEPGLFANE